MFPCFQSCELLLLPFLSPPMHSLSSLKIVFYLSSILVFSAYFSLCFLWHLPVLIFFQGVLQTHWEGTKLPWELQLCYHSFFRTQHEQGKKKNNNISFGKTQNVFSASTCPWCVPVGAAVTFHMPGIGMACLVPSAMGVPHIVSLTVHLEHPGCKFLFLKIFPSVCENWKKFIHVLMCVLKSGKWVNYRNK